MIEVNWMLIVAAILAAVLALRKGGNVMDAIKAFFAALTGKNDGVIPLPMVAKVDAVPTVEARIEAAKLLQGFFASVNCKAGTDAMSVAVDHLLDDMKTHETK